MKVDKDKLQETLIYLVLWGLLFAAPVLSLYVRTASDSNLTFDWTEVLTVWRQLGVFFAFFLIHNFLLAPLLVYQQRRALYAGLIAVFIGCFTVYECNDKRPGMPDGKMPMHQTNHQPPMHEAGNHRPPEFDNHFDGHRPMPRPDDEHRPPLLFGQHDFISIVIFLLMLAANLGMKNYFSQRRKQRQMAELQRHTLEQQLEYLKYQLNPHFLMNTLNNIHALVDIDPEQSKEAIIQLSKILRYVLYESNHERVPISKENEFMDNYTLLMRMRYGDKLSFSVDFPTETAGASVPPLLFITFVENAFKHGVSYQEPSFISIAGKRHKDKNGHERLLWTCRNSKHQKKEQTAIPRQGGVGLTNVRQRLDLIYADRYSLGVNETDDTYEVILDIPLEL